MRRLAIVLTSSALFTACGQWKGDGSDEVLPDVVGIASHGAVPPAFGVPSGTYNDHADVDIRENRPPMESEEAETPSEGERPAHGAAPAHGEAPAHHGE